MRLKLAVSTSQCTILISYSPLQLLLYEYYSNSKVTFESGKDIPQEEITWISLELVIMADGHFSLIF